MPYREKPTKAMRSFVYQRDRGRCQLCGRKVTWLFHLDHIKPSAHGGSTIPSNLRLSCATCNQKRGTGKRRSA